MPQNGPFLTSIIPQADRLEKVIQTIEAVNEGANTDDKIGEAISYTNRQGRYYRHAAEILGFIINDSNNAIATKSGKELAMAEPLEKVELLKMAIARNPFFANIINHFEQAATGLSVQDLRDYVNSISDNSAQSTIPRRVNTILSWLQFTNIIIDDEDGKYYYNNSSNFEIDETYDEQPVYPDNYSQEIDISEQKMTAFEILRKIKSDKIILNPEFQRNFVWKKFQKSQFIESIILNIPIPPIYAKMELDGRLTIIDGLQRTVTLQSFLDPDENKNFELEGLTALRHFEGFEFNELPDNIKTRIEDKALSLFVLKPTVPMAVVYDIFNRINTGGTKLERQEIRNCIFIGQATVLLKELSETTEFKNAIDNGIVPTRMKDREAILRILAFKLLDHQQEYDNSMDNFLEKAMKRINRLTPESIEKLKIDFLRIMTKTYEFFGNRNFRVGNENSRGRINIALIESVSHFFNSKGNTYLDNNKEKIITNYHSKLLKNPDFLDSIKYSTGSTAKVIKRFKLASQILSE